MILRRQRAVAHAIVVRAQAQHEEAQRIYEEAHRAAVQASRTITDNHLTEKIEEFIRKGRST